MDKKLFIKNKLLSIRLQLGYKKQGEFADYLKIGRSNYNLIENNKKQVTLIMAFYISDRLKEKIPGIHIEDIFELVNND